MLDAFWHPSFALKRSLSTTDFNVGVDQASHYLDLHCFTDRKMIVKIIFRKTYKPLIMAKAVQGFCHDQWLLL